MYPKNNQQKIPQMNNNQRKCVDGSTIYYNLETIPENVVTKGPFEAVFLGNVISEMSEGCLFVKQQCKSQYPVVNAQNWKQWITSIDQENRISLAHTIERSGIPILYNTPRLCDPGISVSKNWSLRNYIESTNSTIQEVTLLKQAIHKL